MTGFNQERLGRLNTWLHSLVDTGRYPGVSLFINQEGVPVFSGAYGKRDIEHNLAFTQDTVARIYSMTKPIVSAVLMQYVERGEVHLAAPLSDFLPEFSTMFALTPTSKTIDDVEHSRTPSLHELLLHTSGLSYGFNPGLVGEAMEARKVFRPDGRPLANHVSDLATLPLAFIPGTKWEYSVGIDVIGRVIEVISGKPLDQILRERIFDPLNMDETGFTVPKVCKDRFAACYVLQSNDGMQLSRAGGQSLPYELFDANEGSFFHRPSIYFGGGGLVSSAKDFLKFVEMLRLDGIAQNGQILSPKTVQFMKKNHLGRDIASYGATSFAEQPMHGMGFGIGGSVVIDPGATSVPSSLGDYGWGGMASTFFWIDPIHSISVVFFTQLIPSSAYPTRAELKALVQSALN